jgi:NAD(P)H-dependent flavin oxidoreductase YrpB (nitropropane dioxygenase family)
MNSITNKICALFGIKYPLIQGGMIWCAGWELAAAVSNAGGLGLLGAGGHNGRDQTTTLCLIPMVRKAISIPLIAAGGIGDGRAMLAVMNLGADGAQVGSRFVASIESSTHEHFKKAVVDSQEGDLHAGELEIGQIAGNIETVLPAGAIVQEFITDFNAALTAQSTFLL